MASASAGNMTVDVQVKERMTTIRVIGQIIVAALGVIGTVLGIWMSSSLKGTTDQVDKVIIPALQKTIDEQRADIRLLAESMTTLRERVALLEGKSLGGGHFPMMAPPAASDPKLTKLLARVPEAKLPNLAQQKAE